MSKGSDLKADREVAGNLANVERWLASGRRVFIVSPARQYDLAEQLDAAGRFRLVLKDPLYEVQYVTEGID